MASLVPLCLVAGAVIVYAYVIHPRQQPSEGNEEGKGDDNKVATSSHDGGLLAQKEVERESDPRSQDSVPTSSLLPPARQLSPPPQYAPPPSRPMSPASGSKPPGQSSQAIQPLQTSRPQTPDRQVRFNSPPPPSRPTSPPRDVQPPTTRPTSPPGSKSSRVVQRGAQQKGTDNNADDGLNEMGVRPMQDARFVLQAGPTQHGRNNRARGNKNRIG